MATLGVRCELSDYRGQGYAKGLDRLHRFAAVKAVEARTTEVTICEELRYYRTVLSKNFEKI